jgi:6-phospho-beta-glucosidase
MRSAGYMHIESGSDSLARRAAEPQISGYDRIALSVVRAIHLNTNAVIPLSVRNGGTIPELRENDVVEVPCVVNANGARPLHVGSVPERVRGLLTRVKDYERRTVAAALSPSQAAACDALASNPLVPSRDAAERLVADLSPLW